MVVPNMPFSSYFYFVIAGHRFYSLKVHYGGFFDEKFEHYLGKKYVYFDYVPRSTQSMSVLEEMLQELGIEKGTYVIWFQIPERRLHYDSVMIVERDSDVKILVS